MNEKKYNVLAPDDPIRSTPEFLEMRKRVDAIKTQMRGVKDNPNLTKDQKRVQMEQLLIKLQEDQKIEGKDYPKRSKEQFSSTPDPTTLERIQERRNAYHPDDGYTINDQTGEVSLDLKQNREYWITFWDQYGLDYLPSEALAKEGDRTRLLLQEGYDGFIGIPDISSDQLREICAKEGIKIWSPERLDLPTINRDGLPTQNYLLAVKIAKEAKDQLKEETNLPNDKLTHPQTEKLAKQKNKHGFTYKEYLILQLIYKKQTGNYLDVDSWSWLLDQEAPDSGYRAVGNFNDDEVNLNQNDPQNTNSGVGLRLSEVLDYTRRYFIHPPSILRISSRSDWSFRYCFN